MGFSRGVHSRLFPLLLRGVGRVRVTRGVTLRRGRRPGPRGDISLPHTTPVPPVSGTPPVFTPGSGRSLSSSRGSDTTMSRSRRTRGGRRRRTSVFLWSDESQYRTHRGTGRGWVDLGRVTVFGTGTVDFGEGPVDPPHRTGPGRDSTPLSESHSLRWTDKRRPTERGGRRGSPTPLQTTPGTPVGLWPQMETRPEPVSRGRSRPGLTFSSATGTRGVGPCA